MTRSGYLFILLLSFLISSCALLDSAPPSTPTSFPVTVPPQRVTTAAPIPITLENLAANPDFYVGATLQISGNFRRLPFLACHGRTFPSPATWGLEENGILASAAGMDEQLRSLLTEGQRITVEGRWLNFQGPIGCEPDIQDQTIWYLSADRVLDPHPLVRHQTTDIVEDIAVIETGATAIADVPATISSQATSTISILPSATFAVASTVTVLPTAATMNPVINASASPAPMMTPTVDSGAATPTLAPDTTPTIGATSSPTPTVESTSDPSSATATASPTSPSSGAAPVDKGDLDVEDLSMNTLGADSTDRWTLDLIAGDAITLTVAPASQADIILSVLDGNGNSVVNEQNLAPAGGVETISNLNITSPGIHSLLIQTVEGNEIDYALMFLDQESFSFVFRGLLSEGSSQNDSLPADTDHFWFFNAQSGEGVSFTITPGDGGDPYIELYDPDGSRMLTIDDTAGGEVESLDSYTLLDGGMYGIRVAEFDFLPMAYRIDLSLP